MPVSGKSFLPGNFCDYPDYLNRASQVLPGFDAMYHFGLCKIEETGAIAFPILNVNDTACIIEADARDPAYLYQIAFTIPDWDEKRPNPYGSNVITGTNGDTLKIATAATVASATTAAVAEGGVATTFSATAGVVASTEVGAGEITSIIQPAAPVALTANTTLQLFSTDGANAAGSNLSVAQGIFWIPVRVSWLKRSRTPSMSDIAFSKTQIEANNANRIYTGT